MLRSPNKRYDSDPDLSARVPLRKRKHDEDLADTFKMFSESIMIKFDNMKVDFDKNLSLIKNDLKETIKTDLQIITETSQEMKNDISTIRKEYSAMRSLVQDIHLKHEELQKEVVSLQQSAQFTSNQQEELKMTVASLSKDVKRVDNFQKQLDELKIENAQLKLEMNSREQRERLLNIEIVGIPEVSNEDLIGTVRKIAKIVGVDITPADILTVNRVSPKIKKQGRPRVIIAKLASRLMKDNIISGSRKRRVTTSDLDASGNPHPIFINEHLTPHNKQLLKKCKETAKVKEYQYTWIKNGRIFVRKCDTAPFFQIATEEDMKKM